MYLKTLSFVTPTASTSCTKQGEQDPVLAHQVNPVLDFSLTISACNFLISDHAYRLRDISLPVPAHIKTHVEDGSVISVYHYRDVYK